MDIDHNLCKAEYCLLQKNFSVLIDSALDKVYYNSVLNTKIMMPMKSVEKSVVDTWVIEVSEDAFNFN